MATLDRCTHVPEGETPWYASYPEPKTIVPLTIARSVLLSQMQRGEVAGKDFVLIDLRRADHRAGAIRGSINLPVQSLYPTIPSLYLLFAAAGIKSVIWYCNSSRGRGTRAAAWFTDYLKEQSNDTMESCLLEGGVKGWATGGDEYVRMMDGYDASAWQ